MRGDGRRLGVRGRGDGEEAASEGEGGTGRRLRVRRKGGQGGDCEWGGGGMGGSERGGGCE